MMETKLMVNIGLKAVFGSFVSLSVAAMLHFSPPGNEILLVSCQKFEQFAFQSPT